MCVVDRKVSKPALFNTMRKSILIHKNKGFAFSVSASEQQNYFKENVVYLSLA